MSLSSIGQPAPLPDALSDPRKLEPFAKIELVVVDLDGTLMSDIDDVPGRDGWARRARLVNSLRARSIPLTIATGRALSGARGAIAAVVRRKNLPVILYNGSVVLTADRTLLAHKKLPQRAIQELSEVALVSGGSALFYWIQATFSGQLQGEWATYVGEAPSPKTEFNGMDLSAQSSVPVDASCVAALLWSENSATHLEMSKKVSELKDLSATLSGSRYIEIRPLDSTKGVALKEVLSHLKLTPSQVMAIGDNDNDIELLSAVDISVSVANASLRARSVSNFTTKYPSSSGVIEALQLIKLARRLFSGKKG